MFTKTKSLKHSLAKIISLIGTIGFVPMLFITKGDSFVIYLCCFSLSLIALSTSLFSNNYKLTYWALSIFATSLVQYSLNFNAKLPLTHYPDFLWIVSCVLISLYGLGRKPAIFILLINLIGVFYFVFFNLNDHITFIKPQSFSEQLGLFIEIIICIFIIGIFIIYYTKAIKQNINKLKGLNSELEIKNELINNQNKEKTILIQEIHHRVKNNLQIIVSLLRLQLSSNDSLSNNEQLIKLTNRIHSMSLVHQKLYQKEDLTTLVLEDYIIDLYEHIKRIFDIGKNMILNLESEVSSISYESMIPVGLIINELMTNSFKYAEKGNNIIKISFTKIEDDLIQLKYDDQSKYEFFNKENLGFGIELIIALVEQLDGTITEKGNSKIITFEAK